MTNLEKKIIKDIFEKMKDGFTPRFGSPKQGLTSVCFLESFVYLVKNTQDAMAVGRRRRSD